MPFKSEKQRKLLWAKRPKLARKWTDKYGSDIEKRGFGKHLKARKSK